MTINDGLLVLCIFLSILQRRYILIITPMNAIMQIPNDSEDIDPRRDA